MPQGTSVARLTSVISFSAIIVAMALSIAPAHAATITILGKNSVALGQVLPTNSLSLGAGTWSASRTSATGSVVNVWRSPWEPTPGVCSASPCNTTAYWTMGVSGAANAPNPATLEFTTGQSGLKFLWGSVDTYNRITFLRQNGSEIGTVTGSQIISAGADTGTGVVNVLLSGLSENFFKVRFESVGSNAFEISNITAVPLPAAAWLFISALGGLIAIGRRRRTKKAAA